MTIVNVWFPLGALEPCDSNVNIKWYNLQYIHLPYMAPMTISNKFHVADGSHDETFRMNNSLLGPDQKEHVTN